MADIKTKDSVKGTIKTIDKAAVASDRMRKAYILRGLYKWNSKKIRR